VEIDMNKLLTATAFAAIILSANAYAVPISPGDVIFTNGVTIGDTVADPVDRPYLGGVVMNDNLIDFTYDPTPGTPFTLVGGKVQNRVVENSDGNMVFMQRMRDIYNIDGGTFAITAVRLDGYAGVTVDADFRLDGLGDKGFSSVSRSADGDLMTFRYEDLIFADSINPPGLQEESYFPAMLTDAMAYDTSGTMTIYGEILPLGSRTPSNDPANLFSMQLDGIVAPQVVPEPSTLAIWSALGFWGFVFKARRR